MVARGSIGNSGAAIIGGIMPAWEKGANAAALETAALVASGLEPDIPTSVP